MRAALRHLAEKGIEALKPQKVVSKLAQNGFNTRLPEVWRRPVVSKRVGNTLRKQALSQGTYGSFDAATGVGWDPAWDLRLKQNQYQVERFGGIRPKKKTSRERNREDRAKQVEEQLESSQEKLEEYYNHKQDIRVEETTFEAHYKKMVKLK
jgi:hypothetical protein